MPERRPEDEPATTDAAADPQRPGLPAPGSIVSESTFVSPKGNTYRIIRTNEADPGDPPLKRPARRKRGPKPGPSS